jgi:hypothetical protein
MTQPDFGGEEDQDRQPGILPQDREDSPEREITERGREERDLELEYLDEDNEAHAAGRVCARCGAVITAGQDTRRRSDGRWIHEVCPLDLGEPPREAARPPGHH